jgi:transposase
LDATTGVARGQRTISASDAGTVDALRFLSGLDQDRVWAVEDCRHVSARLERGLLAAGERVIRIAPALAGPSRKATREAGKSDPIDARAVALAALRDGLRWHLVTIAPELEAQLLPAALNYDRTRARLARQLTRLPLSPQLCVTKAILKRIGQVTLEERTLHLELTALINAHAPQLLEQPGCGTVTAAIIIGHTAGAKRFRNDGCFARHESCWV